MTHIVSRQAEADLDEVWLYVALDSGDLNIATRLIEELTRRFFLLAQFPFAGRSRESELGMGMRTFVAGEYIVVYTVEQDHVAILRVVHGKRDFDALFRR